MDLAVSNADKTRRLSALIDTYKLDTCKAQLEAAHAPVQVRIGFVGEFSSGKSTLLNAVLGEALLPSRSTPTTANVIQLDAQPGLERVEYLRLAHEGSEQRLTADEFTRLACGETRCTLQLRVPPRGLLQPGVQLLDSPGLNALVSGHAEVTLAQLATLDGLVVCLHCELGTVPASVLRFLEREEVRALAPRLLFVLTAADQKAPASASRVAASMADALLGVSPERPVVVSTQALSALDGQPEGIADFERAFQANFLTKAEVLREERRATQLRHCAELVLTSLTAYQASLAYSDEEFRQKLAEGQQQLDSLQQLKTSHERRLANWYEGFRRELQGVGEHFAPIIGRTAPEQLDTVLAQLQTLLQDTARTQLQRYDPKVDVAQRALPPELTASLVSALRSHAKYVEHGVTAATMLVVAVATAGAGAGATVATEVATATAATQSTAAVAVKAGAKVVAKKAAEEAAESVFKHLLKETVAHLAGTLKAINPLEVAGDAALNLWNASEAAKTLPRLTSRLAEAYREDLQRHLDTVCFGPLEEQLRAAENGLVEAREARSASLGAFASQRESVARARQDLERLLEEAAVGTR